MYEVLAELAVSQRFEKSQVIVLQGAPADDMYLVVSGEVSVYSLRSGHNQPKSDTERTAEPSTHYGVDRKEKTHPTQDKTNHKPRSTTLVSSGLCGANLL